MRRSVSIFFIIAAIGWCIVDSSPVLAAEKQALEFAVVDMQKVLREAAATRKIRPQMDKLKETYQKKFKKYEEDLKAENQDLQRQRSILSPEAFAERQKTFKKRVNERQREVQTVRGILDRAGSVALSKVHRAFFMVTAELAKERSLQLIVRKSSLLFAQPEHDISAEVLKRLNKQLPQVAVEISKPDGNPRNDAPTKK